MIKRQSKAMNFEQFKSYLFDRKEAQHAWYQEESYDDLVLPATVIVELAGDIFANVGAYRLQYAERQLVDGLRFLIDPFGGLGDAFLDQTVLTGVKIAAIRKMGKVFESLFFHTCRRPELFSSAGSQSRSYDSLCYMWWDVFPRHGIPSSAAMKEIDSSIIDTIISSLSIDNVACQEASLHGLGHWYLAKPDIVEEAIGKFLPIAPSILMTYAQCAAKGDVR